MTIELLLKLKGVGSASGIFYDINYIYVVSDNANYLYQYNVDTASLSRICLEKTEVMENVPKPYKFDLESVARFEHSLYIFGSGSTDKRNIMFKVDLATMVASKRDISEFYIKLQNIAKISHTDFNIEGALFNDGRWYFFQRGNCGSARNGIFVVRGDFEDANSRVTFNAVTLPKIGSIESSFTDAVLLDNKIYFLATAENTESTYHDGEILGTLIGEINLNQFTVSSSHLLSSTLKLEGLTMFSRTPSELQFLVCDDNDCDEQASGLYKVSIPI